MLDLHGEALSRMLDALGPRGDPAADRLLERMAADDLIRGVLLLHGLHPMDLRRRVEGALELVRPYMRSHGGGVELLGVAGDTVRIRLQGHCQGCPSSMVTLKLAVEKAIYEAAPDVAAIEVVEPDGCAGSPAPRRSPGSCRCRSSLPHPASGIASSVSPSGEWVTLAARAAQIGNGSVLKTTADRRRVLIARAGDVFYAYVAPVPPAHGAWSAPRSTEPRWSATSAAPGTTSAAPARASSPTSAWSRFRSSRSRECLRIAIPARLG